MIFENIVHIIGNLNTLRYDSYNLLTFKVVDNTVNGQLSANTGLAYDKTRRLIYSAVTPITGTTTGIHVFNEDGVYQSQLPIVSIQGFDYDPVNDQFIVWSQGGASSTLTTYDYDGTVSYTQSSFDPYGDGTASGSVCIDYINNKMLLSSDGASDIKIFVKSGDDWVYDSDLGATDPEEGVTYDENTNTYWYNRTDVIVNIDPDGNELTTIPQTTETINVNEGLAFNPIKDTLYVNSDKGFHGGVTDGNRCIELYPKFNE